MFQVCPDLICIRWVHACFHWYIRHGSHGFTNIKKQSLRPKNTPSLQAGEVSVGRTVEPALRPVIRSPSYYGQFFSARQNGHTFHSLLISLQKKPLKGSPVNTANAHILKSQTVESLIISQR